MGTPMMDITLSVVFESGLPSAALTFQAVKDDFDAWVQDITDKSNSDAGFRFMMDAVSAARDVFPKEVFEVYTLVSGAPSHITGSEM